MAARNAYNYPSALADTIMQYDKEDKENNGTDTIISPKPTPSIAAPVVPPTTAPPAKPPKTYGNITSKGDTDSGTKNNYTPTYNGNTYGGNNYGGTAHDGTWGSGEETASDTSHAATTAAEPEPDPNMVNDAIDVPGIPENPLDKTQYDADMQAALDQLIASYEANSAAYEGKTPEEIRQQAENEFASYYEQMRLSSQQAADTQDLALQQQRDSLQMSYDKSREASAREYMRAYSQADRALLRRGMQRSSYGMTALANVDINAAKAQQALWNEQIAAETRIDQQRTQLATQLAQQLLQYDANQQRDILARIQEITDQEYDRSVANADRRISLATQVYQLIYQNGRDNIGDQQWMANWGLTTHQQLASEEQWRRQFNETVREFNQQNGVNGHASSISGRNAGQYSGGAAVTNNGSSALTAKGDAKLHGDTSGAMDPKEIEKQMNDLFGGQ